MDDYTYIPDSSQNDQISEIQEQDKIEQPMHSTSLQELDIIIQQERQKMTNYDLPQDTDLYNKEQLRLRNSQYDYTVQEDGGNEPIYNTINPQRTKLVTQYPKTQQPFSVKVFLNKVANSYIDILTDLINGKISTDTFTKDFRTISLALLMIIISVFFVFFQSV